MFTKLLNKLKEPSTWRGLAILVGAVGAGIDPAAIEVIGAGVAGALGMVEVARAETVQNTY